MRQALLDQCPPDRRDELQQLLDEFPPWPGALPGALGHAEDGCVYLNVHRLDIYIHEVAHAMRQRAGLSGAHDTHHAQLAHALLARFGLRPNQQMFCYDLHDAPHTSGRQQTFIAQRTPTLAALPVRHIQAHLLKHERAQIEAGGGWRALALPALALAFLFVGLYRFF